MCGGGGGVPQDRSVEVEELRQEEARRVREEERRLAEEEKQARREKYTTELSRARASALNRGMETLSQRGLNPDEYGGVVHSALENQLLLVPQDDPSPGSYFTDEFIANALNKEQSGRRSQYVRRVDELFKPNFEQQFIAPTMDDAYIEDILKGQREEAMLQLNRAKARGNIDDIGYTASLRRMDDLFKAGTSQGQQLGDAVLQGYRTDLRNIGSSAREKAGQYELGASFNPDDYLTERDTRLSDINSRLEGDIRGAVGSQKFFDIGDILTRGGLTQGAVNPRLDLPAILAQRTTKQDAERGIGGAGTF